VKGHGGHKGAVRQTHNWVTGHAYTFICKTDIRGYYAHINKSHMFTLLSRHISCPIMLNLLHQFLHYSVEKSGTFHQPRLGIPRGCPLSPLLAGFHLFELDQDLSTHQGVRYLRFMDDLLILARTRWQLKRAVATMNHWFEAAGLEQHPDKTFIGRICRGFYWLGYQFDNAGICGASQRTIQHATQKLRRLYEQAERSSGRTNAQGESTVSEYVRRWQKWFGAGLNMTTTQANPWVVNACKPVHAAPVL